MTLKERFWYFVDAFKSVSIIDEIKNETPERFKATNKWLETHMTPQIEMGDFHEAKEYTYKKGFYSEGIIGNVYDR